MRRMAVITSCDVVRCVEAAPVILACALDCWELGLAWGAVLLRPSGPPGWRTPWAALQTDPAAVSSATAGSDKVRSLQGEPCCVT